MKFPSSWGGQTTKKYKKPKWKKILSGDDDEDDFLWVSTNPCYNNQEYRTCAYNFRTQRSNCIRAATGFSTTTTSITTSSNSTNTTTTTTNTTITLGSVVTDDDVELGQEQFICLCDSMQDILAVCAPLCPNGSYELTTDLRQDYMDICVADNPAAYPNPSAFVIRAQSGAVRAKGSLGKNGLVGAASGMLGAAAVCAWGLLLG
jgi:hypothetical protein